MRTIYLTVLVVIFVEYAAFEIFMAYESANKSCFSNSRSKAKEQALSCLSEVACAWEKF